jgi:hypothetical protein
VHDDDGIFACEQFGVGDALFGGFPVAAGLGAGVGEPGVPAAQAEQVGEDRVELERIGNGDKRTEFI